ncbi:MAG TPA: alanine dehydrogenase [Bryobacteraceae bacterium]|nr:alanine dehydrogenase [Bryobacteraceae bacterium]
MNIALIREGRPFDRRVALTPPVVRHLVEAGHAVWVESGAGEGAWFQDAEYARTGARIVYSQEDVLHRSDLVARISTPVLSELRQCPHGMILMAFYHMAVADRVVVDRLIEQSITAIGLEMIQRDDGTLPVLRAASEIAGQMTVPIAAHLLRSSSGGRGVLLGGSPGIPPGNVVILGAGVVGTWAARTACAAGARVTVLDVNSEKLRKLMEHLPNVETCLAESESVAAFVASADVVIGAVLVAGKRTPHVVTRAMVETMKPGSAIIDVAIDQGGCVETSHPTTIADPTFVYHGVTHYCVPNLTADMGRSTSVAVAQALLPYLLQIGELGIDDAMQRVPDVARGAYTHQGKWIARNGANSEPA